MARQIYEATHRPYLTLIGGGIPFIAGLSTAYETFTDEQIVVTGLAALAGGLLAYGASSLTHAWARRRDRRAIERGDPAIRLAYAGEELAFPLPQLGRNVSRDFIFHDPRYNGSVEWDREGERLKVHLSSEALVIPPWSQWIHDRFKDIGHEYGIDAANTHADNGGIRVYLAAASLDAAAHERMGRAASRSMQSLVDLVTGRAPLTVADTLKT